jgi:hypothetical protein
MCHALCSVFLPLLSKKAPSIPANASHSWPAQRKTPTPPEQPRHAHTKPPTPLASGRAVCYHTLAGALRPPWPTPRAREAARRFLFGCSPRVSIVLFRERTSKEHPGLSQWVESPRAQVCACAAFARLDVEASGTGPWVARVFGQSSDLTCAAGKPCVRSRPGKNRCSWTTKGKNK